jgi:putative transposase
MRNLLPKWCSHLQSGTIDRLVLEDPFRMGYESVKTALAASDALGAEKDERRAGRQQGPLSAREQDRHDAVASEWKVVEPRAQRMRHGIADRRGGRTHCAFAATERRIAGAIHKFGLDSEEQIIAVLKARGRRAGVGALPKHGISDATFYNWRSCCGGMEVSDAKRLKGLKEEKRKLKKLGGEAENPGPSGAGLSPTGSVAVATGPDQVEALAVLNLGQRGVDRRGKLGSSNLTE